MIALELARSVESTEACPHEDRRAAAGTILIAAAPPQTWRERWDWLWARLHGEPRRAELCQDCYAALRQIAAERPPWSTAERMLMELGHSRAEARRYWRSAQEAR